MLQRSHCSGFLKHALNLLQGILSVSQPCAEPHTCPGLARLGPMPVTLACQAASTGQTPMGSKWNKGAGSAQASQLDDNSALLYLGQLHDVCHSLTGTQRAVQHLQHCRLRQLCNSFCTACAPHELHGMQIAHSHQLCGKPGRYLCDCGKDGQEDPEARGQGDHHTGCRDPLRHLHSEQHL